jgi:hypothetical protein
MHMLMVNAKWAYGSSAGDCQIPFHMAKLMLLVRVGPRHKLRTGQSGGPEPVMKDRMLILPYRI